jgi:membrane protein
VFGELHAALDTIWGVQPKPGRGVWGIVCDRLISFLAVLCTGVLLLLSLVITTALYTLGRYLPMLGLSDNVHLWEAINWLISLVVFTLLFAMIYKVLPDVGLAWRDVWVGAAVTALLFDIGRFLIGVYIGSSVEASAYGAAGSLVVLLLWVYYSALVFLLGAEFTFVYTQRNGRPVKPSANAEWADGRCGDPVAADMHPAARDQASAAS